MMKSDTIEKLAAALAKAAPKIQHATKDSANEAFKKNGKVGKYADLTSYLDASRDALSAHGLSIVQGCAADGGRVSVTTMLLHDSGQWISSELTMTAAQNTPQGIGSTITYARRYSLAAMLNMGADDDDGNHASGRSQQEQQHQRHDYPDQEYHEEPPARHIDNTPGVSRSTYKSAAPAKDPAPDATPSGGSALTPPVRYELVCDKIVRALGQVPGNKKIAEIRARHGADLPEATKEQKLAALAELEEMVSTAVAR